MECHKGLDHYSHKRTSWISYQDKEMNLGVKLLTQAREHGDTPLRWEEKKPSGFWYTPEV